MNFYDQLDEAVDEVTIAEKRGLFGLFSFDHVCPDGSRLEISCFTNDDDPDGRLRYSFLGHYFPVKEGET